MGTHPIFESDFDCLTVMESRIDLSKPQYDQNTYWGRVSHFSKLTDPRNLALSDSELTRARDIVNRHKSGENTGLSVAALWNEKYKYDSAYHPESGQKMFLPGRMSAWVPANMCITGAMLAFQKTPGQIIFWQFANQSVNAAVNFTNRSGGDEIPTTTLACNFVGATTLAVGVAMGVKRFAPKSLSRLSPFFAVCAANCLNTPLMRSSELTSGVRVIDEDEKHLGDSVTAAQQAIGQVCGVRIACAVPAMVIPLYGMMALERRFPQLVKRPMAAPAIQVALVGISLLLANPLTCALFPQCAGISIDRLEEPIRANGQPGQTVYFNRGL